MFKRFANVITIVFLFLGLSASADEVVEFELRAKDGYLIRPHSFSIHNATGRDIVFYLAAEGEDLERYQLSENMVKEFSDGKSDRYTIKVPTGDRGNVIYVLIASNRYQIYWNEKAGRWDVFELIIR